MASKSKRFIDSPEEFELKRIFQILTGVTLERCIFINSIISSCNGMKSQRFSSAHVSLQEDVDLQQFRENGTGSLQHLILSCRDILMMDILRKVSDGGVKEIPAELDFIFLALLEFLKDIDSHKESMLRYRHQGALKSDVIKVMAVHLFSQLIPSPHVEVDDESSTSNLCPCSCGRKIQLSCTGIGSPLTWHGNTDIIVNQEIPVLVLEERLEEVDITHLEKKSDIIIQESVKMANEGVSSVRSEGEKLAETESEEEEPSLRKVRKKIGKKRKISDIYDSNEEEGSDFNTAETSFGRMVKDGDESVDDRTINRSSQDVIRRKEIIESVLTETVLGQLIAQTISNAFVQVNKNESLSGFMIPLIGCSISELYFCLYNPNEDILLRSASVFELFSPIMHELNKEVIVILWIFLNFKAFVKPHIWNVYELNPSNFKGLAQNALSYYKEGKLNIRFPEGVSYPDYYLRYLKFYGQKATNIAQN